jgi:hypothetical protein
MLNELKTLKQFVITAFLWTTCVVAPIDAVELDNQSNLVPLDFAAGAWADPAAWSAIPRYAADPLGDSSPLDGYDWEFTQVAHDDFWIYLRYANSHPFGGDRQLIYLDTDSDPNTGLPGFTGTLAVGAEYYISGAAFNTDGIGFTGWVNWNNVQNGSGGWDIMVAVDRTQFLPGVTSFNFVNQNHDQGGDDWYPDAANTFPGGDWFRYEASNPTESAFGRDWTVFEPMHRDSDSVQADVVGTADSLTLTGVFGYPIHTAAVTPITPEVGTKVSYDFALTHEPRDPVGDGNLETWVAEAFGAFVNTDYDSSNAGIVSTRVGTRPFDDEATRIVFETVGGIEEGSASLLDSSGTSIEHHLADGVHIEWLFTSETTIEVSVFSQDGSELLGPTFVDEINSIADIHGFRFNVYDSEQTLSVSNFAVEIVDVSIPGDFNGDGQVDGADLTDPVLGWQVRYGTDLDGRDFLDWQRNFGTGVPQLGSVLAVPEPTAIVLMIGGILCFAQRHIRNCHLT